MSTLVIIDLSILEIVNVSILVIIDLSIHTEEKIVFTARWS